MAAITADPARAIALFDENAPAVTMSRGGKSDGAHPLDEWWEPEDIHLGPQIGLLTILAEAVLSD